ncbi:MAG: nucleotide pyrophosphatase/phosphodiesterase family protein [Planctomycetota bacterium]
MNSIEPLILLTIPGLRADDVDNMPNLQNLISNGCRSRIEHSFPAVTWPSQANLLTGKKPNEHGVIANGFYWRNDHKVEMWTAWNEVIQQPQLWDTLKALHPDLTSSAWFPMLSKGCGAEFVCMPAPIHKPDGSEDLWCYTKPQEFYGELLEQFGHFPLQHFWGPMANILSSKWIAETSVKAAEKFKPHFNYIYLPHLDYAAQKHGPDSSQAIEAVEELDQLIGTLRIQMESAYSCRIHWIVVSEYTITPVDHVSFPNRFLREHGWLKTTTVDGREHLDFANSEAWALVDHQFSHVFVQDRARVKEIANRLQSLEGIQTILAGEDRAKLSMDHDRSGEILLVSEPNSWQAYYWWNDDQLAPEFATNVDIHRKPGYDPIELHFDMATKSVPLDATLAKGSHGAPANSDPQKGVFLSSMMSNSPEQIAETDVFNIVTHYFQSQLD